MDSHSGLPGDFKQIPFLPQPLYLAPLGIASLIDGSSDQLSLDEARGHPLSGAFELLRLRMRHMVQPMP